MFLMFQVQKMNLRELTHLRSDNQLSSLLSAVQLLRELVLAPT